MLTNLKIIQGGKFAKYSYGSIQANIDSNSSLYNDLTEIQDQIDTDDLKAKGIENNLHVTVRYGVIDDNFTEIKKYLSSLKPFYITLEKLDYFPPNENTDNAAVLTVKVNSPDLVEINYALAGYGNFKPADFQYNPHITLAYLDKTKIKYYLDNLKFISTSYLINNIACCYKDENIPQEEVKLQNTSSINDFGTLKVYIPNNRKNQNFGKLIVKDFSKEDALTKFSKFLEKTR